MVELAISFLGRFSIVYQGEPLVTLNSDRLRSLFVYLLLHRGALQARQHIAFLLWPDSSESQARTNLRNLLFGLRAGLPDNVALIESSHATIAWRPTIPYTLDVAEFEQRIDEAQGANLHGATTEEQCLLEAAIALYRGDLLPGNHDGWVVRRRQELRGQYQEALARLLALLEAKREVEAALRLTHHLLQQEPLNEHTYVHIMRLHALNGDRGAVHRTYETCVALLQRELQVEPNPTTRQAYLSFLRPIEVTAADDETAPAGVVPPSSPHVSGLPVPQTSFVGREVELAQLTGYLADPHCRLLTIVGPGGIGKTRLALQLARDHVAAGEDAVGEDGVFFVPLVSVVAGELLVSTIANTLGLVLNNPGTLEEQLLSYLQDRSLLLVLDNFEHLLPEAGLIDQIVARAPHVKVLVTSRERLNLLEEWVFDLHGLATPSDVEGMAMNDAIQLFVNRARHVDHAFALTVDNGRDLVQICRLMEGMPLGIELAAAWVRMLPPAEIVAEIERSIDSLAATARNVPQRHRSLRAVFDHSWQLLTAAEQQVFGRLALFRGGFTREAAWQVAGADLVSLAALLDKSLIRRSTDGRYDLHERVRQYAESKLLASGADYEQTCHAYARYYTQILRARDEDIHSSAQSAVMAELMGDVDNVRAAWTWSVDHGMVAWVRHAIRCLGWFYELSGWYHEGATLFARAANELFAANAWGDQEPSSPEAIALAHLRDYQGYFSFRSSRQDRAYMLLQEALALARRTNDALVIAETLMSLGFVTLRLGNQDEGQRLLQEAVDLSHANGYTWTEGMCLSHLGMAANRIGDYDEAEVCFDRALLLLRQVGDPTAISYCLGFVGGLHARAGRFAQAQAALQEGLALSEDANYSWGTAFILSKLGISAFLAGNYEESVSFLQRALYRYREIGDRWSTAWTFDNLARTFQGMGCYEEGKRYFLTALRLADEIAIPTLVYSVLVGLSSLLAQNGEAAEAYRLLSALARSSDYSPLSAESEEQAQALLATLGETLPVGQVAEMQKQVPAIEHMINGLLGKPF